MFRPIPRIAAAAFFVIAPMLYAQPPMPAQQPAVPASQPGAPAPPGAAMQSGAVARPRPQRPQIVQQLTFAPYHSTGIYKIGETVGWTVTPGPVTPTYSYKYTVRRNNNVVLKEGKLDLTSGKDTIEITGDQPEMIYVAVEPYAVLPVAAPTADAASPLAAAAATAPATQTPGAPPVEAAARSVTDAAAGGGPSRSPYTGGNTGRNNGLYAVGAAVAPLQIPMDTPRPADFDAFWSGKLAEQAKIPINPVLTPVQSDVPGVWSREYSFVEKWHIPRLDAASLNTIYGQIRSGAEASAQWLTLLNVSSAHDHVPANGVRALECAMEALDPAAYKACYCPIP